MNLDQAFKMAVQKYYEGYDYSESKNIGLKGKEYEYDWDKLDGLQQEVKKPKKRSYNRKVQSAPAMDDFETEDDSDLEGFGVNSGEEDDEGFFE